MRPLLAAPAPADGLDFPLLASAKLDGIRAFIRDGCVWTRKGEPMPNLHVQRFWLEDEKRWVKLRLTTAALRTIGQARVEPVPSVLSMPSSSSLALASPDSCAFTDFANPAQGGAATSLLVVQGKNDPRVPYQEADQIVATVKANGSPVWYMTANDEGHGFGKKANADYQFFASIDFLRTYLLAK